MAGGNSQALNSAARILKLVRQKAYAATLATIEKAARQIMDDLDSYRRYYNITGNAWTSTTIGVYYKGKLVLLLNKGADDDAPTRPSLREGERYNLPYYYKGRSVGKKVYRGEYGRGGQWGPSLGPWYMRRQHSPKYKTWNMIVAIPVSYAGFSHKITATMQSIMTSLPNVIDYNIVRVENAPSQSGIDFDNDAPF